MHKKALKINTCDNVAVALTKLEKNDSIQISSDEFIIPLETIPAKHKVALCNFETGHEIKMYGVVVGKAIKQIQKGQLISTLNIQHAIQQYGLRENKINWSKPDISKWKQRTFMGYHRKDGSVGTANHWLVIPLVFCENKNVQVLEEAFQKALGYKPHHSYFQEMIEKLVDDQQMHKQKNDLTIEKDRLIRPRIFPNITGIKFLTHTMGCGGTRQDARALCGLLAGYITHANVAGATVLSLGCQNAQLSILKEEIQKRDKEFQKPLILLEQQQIGKEEQMLEEAVKKTFECLVEVNKMKREPAGLEHLCFGVECGGSDGFSGISANPAVGYASDILVALGGSVILSEFPELCGVEQELMDRCIDKETASKFLYLMDLYKKRAKEAGSGFDANPSPGNIKDGLITDAIKSAGAARKGGSSPVIDVLDYPEKIMKQGLNLLCTPGSDIESTTAEVGAGANIVLFTTGLGTPTGNPIVPVLKISTTTSLYSKMNDIIDIDTGSIIDGNETIEEVGERILEYIIKVASGEIKAKADELGHDDFIPWKRGISL